MRTTVNIDDDVLAAVRERARTEHKSVGAVLSDVVRIGLTRTPSEPSATLRNGFALLPPRGGFVTNEMIDKIRDEIGD